jgi:Rrf2 family cysteine metabolism transcriptional repressor
MVELALNHGKGPVYLKDIASSQNISEKYLSLIIIPLRKKGFVNSVRGARGGYKIAQDPSQINLKEIVNLLEGDCSLVKCVSDPSICPRVPICASHDIWAIIGGKITDILNSITLDMLVKMTNEKEKKSRTYNILNIAENLQ